MGDDLPGRSRQAGVEVLTVLAWETVMTSAAINLARSAGGRRSEGRWMIIFAAALLVVVGFFNLIDGIAAIANSHIFNAKV
jgi:hypothetical protein